MSILPNDSGDIELETGDIEVGEPLLEVNNLTKYYTESGFFTKPPVKAVDDVSFTIRKGETLGLVGESGCGKTTLGRTLLQLETATEGEVTSRGTDITKLSGAQLRDWQQDAQMVFQDPESSLNDRMTVGEIIREPLDAHAWKQPEERRDRVFELIDLVGLNEEHYYRYPHQFSGGQRQRIGVARSLALEPEFVVLDEPVSALDVSVQARVINLLEDLQEELGLTYLFIAHDLSVVRHIADRTAVMYLGNIVELGETESLFKSPEHPYTISLLSAIPGSETGTSQDRITLRGTPPNPRYPPDGCPFTTRCPAKIRPAEWDNLTYDQWDAIEEFRVILRERARADRPLREEIQILAGRDIDTAEVNETLDELFGDISLPSEVEDHIETAAEEAKSGNDEKAADYLGEQFGSRCDEEMPDQYEPQEGRISRCLRHEDEYEDPQTVINERFTTSTNE